MTKLRSEAGRGRAEPRLAVAAMLLFMAASAFSAESPAPSAAQPPATDPATQAPATDSATQAPATDSATQPPATGSATQPEPAPLASAVGADYIIGPGDSIQVFVWRRPELTVTVPVRPDGKISAPLVEDLVAVGKTPSQLARDIETRLAEYVRTPQVNVIVAAPANAFNQIKVIGQVHSPSSIAYRAGMTALDAILQAGGFTEFAAGNRTLLVRKEAGKETRTKLRLNDVVKKGKIEANVELRAGDVLIVPESVF
jgi:polysaccharide export outer membrane protein